MSPANPHGPLLRRLLFGAVVMAVLGWVAWRLIRTPDVAVIDPGAADSAATGFRAAKLYFASPDGDSLVAETREMIDVQGVHEEVAALVGELDRGPGSGSAVATLPAGTSVLHAYLDDRGMLTVDLSRAFQKGFRGGASSEYLAVSSLVRTFAANLPDVRRVMIICGGEPLATLGGHLPLDRPIEVTELP